MKKSFVGKNPNSLSNNSSSSIAVLPTLF